MAKYVKFFSSTNAIVVELDGDDEGNGADYGARFNEAIQTLGREIGGSLAALSEDVKPKSMEVSLSIKATPNDGLAITKGEGSGHLNVKVTWGGAVDLGLEGFLGS